MKESKRGGVRKVIALQMAGLLLALLAPTKLGANFEDCIPRIKIHPNGVLENCNAVFHGYPERIQSIPSKQKEKRDTRLEDVSVYVKVEPPSGKIKSDNTKDDKSKRSLTKKGDVRRRSLRRGQVYKLVSRISRKYGVDPALVMAIIKAESSFRRYAVSRKGAKGYMQLMPSTARLYGVKNVFDPAQNIEGGVRYLKFLMKKFGKRQTLAIAAYNAGPTVVSRYGRIPPIRETRRYVKKVLSFYNQYKNRSI